MKNHSDNTHGVILSILQRLAPDCRVLYGVSQKGVEFFVFIAAELPARCFVVGHSSHNRQILVETEIGQFKVPTALLGVAIGIGAQCALAVIEQADQNSVTTCGSADIVADSFKQGIEIFLPVLRFDEQQKVRDSFLHKQHGTGQVIDLGDDRAYPLFIAEIEVANRIGLVGQLADRLGNTASHCHRDWDQNEYQGQGKKCRLVANVANFRH